MKKLIITEEHLRLLEDVADSKKTEVAFTGNNANELGANALEKFNDAKKAGLGPDKITMNGKTMNNNARKGEEVQVSFDTNTPSLQKSITDTVNNAVNNGIDINKLNVIGNPGDLSGTEIAETKTYSKARVEGMRLSEMKRKGTVIKKGQINEVREETAEANKIVKRLYKAVEKYTRGKYQDNDWHSLNQIFDEMRAVPGVREVSVGGGNYHGFFSDSPCKKYKLYIGLECGEIIGGELTCHAAGTVSEPFSSYDVTCSFWRKADKGIDY